MINWTRTSPSEGGYYFIRFRLNIIGDEAKFKEPEIVHAVVSRSRDRLLSIRSVFRGRIEVESPMARYAEWWPVQIPPPPTEDSK